MTNTRTTAPVGVTAVPFAGTAADDPRHAFGRALSTAADVIAAVQADDLGRPTPCGEYHVSELLGHLVAVVRRLAAVGRGESVVPMPDVVEGTDAGAWPAAWSAGVAELTEMWADDAVLGRMLELPWATLPGAVALAIYTSEVTTHTWDLATAIGARVDWDDAVVGAALGSIHQALPAEPRGGDVPFGPVVPTLPDAAPIERLVAWTGRDPGPGGQRWVMVEPPDVSTLAAVPPPP